MLIELAVTDIIDAALLFLLPSGSPYPAVDLTVDNKYATDYDEPDGARPKLGAAVQNLLTDMCYREEGRQWRAQWDAELGTGDRVSQVTSSVASTQPSNPGQLHCRKQQNLIMPYKSLITHLPAMSVSTTHRMWLPFTAPDDQPGAPHPGTTPFPRRLKICTVWFIRKHC